MPSAILTWDPNKEPDLAGYRIYRGFGTATPTLLASVTKDTVTYTDSTLPNLDQAVTYNLTAFDTAGNESAHSVNVTTTVNVNPPQSPLGLAVTIQ